MLDEDFVSFNIEAIVNENYFYITLLIRNLPHPNASFKHWILNPNWSQDPQTPWPTWMSTPCWWLTIKNWTHDLPPSKQLLFCWCLGKWLFHPQSCSFQKPGSLLWHFLYLINSYPIHYQILSILGQLGGSVG